MQANDRTFERVTQAIGRILVDGPWTQRAMKLRLKEFVAKRQTWMRPFVDRVLQEFQEPPHPREIAKLVNGATAIRSAFNNSDALLKALCSRRQTMWPSFGKPESWRVPSLTSPEELAGWLSLPLNRLLWFADGRAEFRKKESGRHYDYRWSPKRSKDFRLIEAPKSQLKRIQRDIADGIIAHIPPHEAAHGFRVGHNIKSYVTPHAGKHFVMRMDLRDFFPTVTRARVAAILRSAGYPESVVGLLTDLVTVRTPNKVLGQYPGTRTPNEKFKAPHLPQGAPTSPSLANLAAYRLDCRLAGLANRFGANYTRYADDLLFSGDRIFAKDAKRFHVFALSIILDEGFEIHPRKTHHMQRGVRQSGAGLVLNQKVNTRRTDYEQLKAILHNCAKYGVDSQNREGHEYFQSRLLGQVNFHAQINPQRGAKLRAAYRLAFPNS